MEDKVVNVNDTKRLELFSDKRHIKRRFWSIILPTFLLVVIVCVLISNFDSLKLWLKFGSIFLVLVSLPLLFILYAGIIKSIWKKSPLYILEENGIKDNFSLSKPRYLKWDDIEEVVFHEIKDMKYLAIRLSKEKEHNYKRSFRLLPLKKKVKYQIILDFSFVKMGRKEFKEYISSLDVNFIIQK